MEILNTVFLFMAGVAIILYVILTETTDWVGRAEVIEKRWPQLWGLMNNRPMRLVLIAVALVMVGHVIQATRAGAEPVNVTFQSPKVPATVIPPQPLGPLESGSSLRRRTVELSDEISNFLRGRFEKHPPYAYTQSNDPDTSETHKAAIKKCQEYDQETMDIYKRKYKDRAVGIIREYHAKGISVGFLEQFFAQQVPVWVQPGSAWEDSPQDNLGQFLELSFHVDAKDQMIVPNF